MLEREGEILFIYVLRHEAAGLKFFYSLVTVKVVKYLSLMCP